MATNDEPGMRWLARSLAWERRVSMLRDEAERGPVPAEAVVDDVAPALVPDAAPEPVGALHSLDERRALRARRNVVSGTCPGIDRVGRPVLRSVDGGFPTSV